MDPKAFSSAVAKFSAKFCNELDKSKSVVSSPLSAEYLLALITLGASDPAHAELLTSLDIPDDDSIRSSFSEFSSKLKAINGITLNVANKVYIKEGSYELNAELKEDAIKVFAANFEKLDFSNGAAAADTINKWVEKQTNDRIKDLLSPESLDKDTFIVLINALYFKGTWDKQFRIGSTMERPFHINTQTTVNVPMMRHVENYRYRESSELQAQLLEMKYVGGDASMLIVLPNDIEGLDGVLQKLADGHDLVSELDKMSYPKVQVTIPKFKIESDIDLKEFLPKLGIRAIFNSRNSGLNKILANPRQLHVSQALQKAFIEVNEEGAEAAAATAILMKVCKRISKNKPKIKTFLANRPFLAAILIRDSIYFLATYRGT